MNRLSALLKSFTPVAWLATLFWGGLILSSKLQASLGYQLQQASAASATALLGVFYRVHQEGSRIVLVGQDLLLESPESSAQCAIGILMIFAVLVVIKRPGWWQSVVGAVQALGLIYVVNTGRITFLAAGVAFPNLVGHINVMAPLWHERISLLLMLLFGLLPLLGWARSIQSSSNLRGKQHKKFTSLKQKEKGMFSDKRSTEARQRVSYRSLSWFKRLKIGLACLFVAGVLVVVAALPAQSVEGHRASHTVLLSVFLQPVPQPVLVFTAQDISGQERPAFSPDSVPKSVILPSHLGKRPKRTLAAEP